MFSPFLSKHKVPEGPNQYLKDRFKFQVMFITLVNWKPVESPRLVNGIQLFFCDFNHGDHTFTNLGSKQ